MDTALPLIQYGLSSSQIAFALSGHAAERRPQLIVCPNRQRAEGLLADVRFFLAHSNIAVRSFFSWDALPFDQLSPSTDVTAARLAACYELAAAQPCIVVTTVEAVMQRIVRLDLLRTLGTALQSGQSVDRDLLVQRLIGAGYVRSSIVEALGQMAVRGSVIDFYTAQLPAPVRIEFFGDEIDSIRLFDAETQRSAQRIEQVIAFPVREFYLGTDTNSNVARFTTALKARAEELQVPTRTVIEMVESLEQGLHTEGVEHLQPLLPETCQSVLGTISSDVVVSLVDTLGIESAADSYADLVAERAARAEADGILFPEPTSAFIAPEMFLNELKARANACYESLHLIDVSTGAAPVPSKRYVANQKLQVTLQQARRSDRPFQPLIDTILQAFHEGLRVGVSSASKARLTRLEGIFAEYHLQSSRDENLFEQWLKTVPTNTVSLFPGDLQEGFLSPKDKFLLISEREIFPDAVIQRKAASFNAVRRYVGKTTNLNVNDFVVHIDHGIGIYRGLRQLEVAGAVSDFLELEYAEGSKLYLPVENIAKVQRYSAEEGVKPTLHRLGGKVWIKTKRKVRERVASIAGELIRLYAQREISEGFSFGPVDSDDLAFADTFEFEPTADQAKAIDDVLADMERARPMDRLVCGDVGYGKTEVALRAAFKAVSSGKQVAVLVPTTVLADQHFNTFCERLAPFPVTVGGLSRFFSPQERKDTIDGLRRGSVDIVIGTHRLLQKDVIFRDLGLVVIDEEHRFGVRAKERLRQLRLAVDVLTLTATPIPRTLHMSMLGLKDLSVIETPPVDRQVIRTYITKLNDMAPSVVRDAILRELGRGGQVFYIHNRVQSIATVAAELREIVPEARIEFAHGQMREHELEKVMHRFIKQEFDVLLSTTIVESGLDIPNANTIIIRNAERFGLAELYQLRGRVGRSSRRAYAYLLVADPKSMSPDAKRRLEVLQALDDLGVGFRLALQDMEIRGAGNLLGKDQSGHINLVGFDLYIRILEETIRSLQSDEAGEPMELAIEPEMQLGFASHIPAEYIPDVAERILLYQRLVGLGGVYEAAMLAEEIEDRFGKLPRDLELLIELMVIRALLRFVGVVKITRQERNLQLSFHPDASICKEIFKGKRRGGSFYKITAEYTLRYELAIAPENPSAILSALAQFFETFGMSCRRFTKQEEGL